MQVSFFATLREIVGARRVELALPDGASLQVILESVLRDYPQLRDELTDETGELSRHVHLFVDGRSSRYLPEGMATVVAAGQKVEFFPAVAGG